MGGRTSRRDFLKRSGLASASLMIPRFLQASEGLMFSEDARQKVLVVIQLSGGNDGLNTVVPFRNDLYYEARPQLGISPDEVIRLEDDTGLNPRLTGLADLYHNGELVIMNSVGYPDPNRSHFRSMDIWQTASGAQEYKSSGWLGRVMDETCPGGCAPHAGVEIDDSLSLAMKGDLVSGFAIRDPRTVRRDADNQLMQQLAQHDGGVHSHENAAFLHKVLRDTYHSTDYLRETIRRAELTTEYPAGELGRQMKTVAELIIAGSETRIYYLSLGGFDTHAGQRGQQDRQLGRYNEAMTAFCQDLRVHGRFQDTLILTFSEFGRRVAQNASRGTDHGTANNVFVAGGGLRRAGIVNELPDLADLQDGDLRHDIDFRSIYATIIDRWLDADAEKVLTGNFGRIDFL